MKTAEDSMIETAERWRVMAACRTAEPELFFPISAHGPSVADAARAKRICASCPVRSPCLDYAVATRQTYGIWGGLTEQERRRPQR